MQFRGVQCFMLLAYIDRIKFSGFDDDRPSRDIRVPHGSGVACHVGEAPTIGTICGNLRIKMSTSSRSRSSTKGSEGYFDWRESMKRRQRESEWQVQVLLQETRRLRKENEVLRIRCLYQALFVVDKQGVSEWTPGKMRRQRTLEMQSPHLMSMICGLMKDPYQPVTRHRTKPLISLISHKKRDAIGNPNYRTPSVEKPRATTTHKVYSGPSTTPIIEDWPPHPPLQ